MAGSRIRPSVSARGCRQHRGRAFTELRDGSDGLGDDGLDQGPTNDRRGPLARRRAGHPRSAPGSSRWRSAALPPPAAWPPSPARGRADVAAVPRASSTTGSGSCRAPGARRRRERLMLSPEDGSARTLAAKKLLDRPDLIDAVRAAIGATRTPSSPPTRPRSSATSPCSASRSTARTGASTPTEPSPAGGSSSPTRASRTRSAPSPWAAPTRSTPRSAASANAAPACARS